MGCISSNQSPYVVPVPFPEDAVSMAFFGERNVELCITHLHSIVTSSPERLNTLKRVRTYVLEAENETGQFDIVVHNPVTEIVSVYQEMLARKEAAKYAKTKAKQGREGAYEPPPPSSMQALRREHALCFMHRHTLRNAGLVFTQEFQLDVLNSQLPLPLPSRPVEKCLRTFKALNFDQSGALTLRQFHTWVASLNGKGGSRARSLERREMLKCFFVPVLMALNPTVKPWKLTAMEFVNMVHDLCCLPDKALVAALFDSTRIAVTKFATEHGWKPPRRPRRSDVSASRGPRRSGASKDGSGSLVLEDLAEGKAAPAPAAAATPATDDAAQVPRDAEGSHVYIDDAAATSNGDGAAAATLPSGGTAPTSDQNPKSLVIRSRILPNRAGAGSPASSRLARFDPRNAFADIEQDGKMPTIPDDEDDAGRDPIHEIPSQHLIGAIRAVFQSIGTEGQDYADEKVEESKASRRMDTGKKTVRFVPSYLGSASTSCFLAGVAAAQKSHESLQQELYDELQLTPENDGSTSRYLFSQAALEQGYLTRVQWRVLNDLHPHILGPVFALRSLVRQAIMGTKFWVHRQQALAERAAQEAQLAQSGAGEESHMMQLTSVGLTAENKQFLHNREIAAAKNRFGIAQADSPQPNGSDGDQDAPPAQRSDAAGAPSPADTGDADTRAAAANVAASDGP